jgi:hypothetical protein
VSATLFCNMSSTSKLIYICSANNELSNASVWDWVARFFWPEVLRTHAKCVNWSLVSSFSIKIQRIKSQGKNTFVPFGTIFATTKTFINIYHSTKIYVPIFSYEGLSRYYKNAILGCLCEIYVLEIWIKALIWAAFH